MRNTLDTTRSPIAAALMSLALIALITGLMYGINVGLSRVEGHPVRPFEMGYLFPVALITLLWGRYVGLAALAVCALAASYFLMPGPGFRIDHASDLAGLGFLAVTGLFMIAAVDAATRNYYLRHEALARVGRESLLSQIARMARSSVDPAEIQRQALAVVAESLDADRSYLIVPDNDNEAAIVSAEWHKPSLAPLSAGGFSPTFSACLAWSEGRTPSSSTEHPHPLMAGTPPAEVGNFGLSSVIHVPLASGEHINAIFGVAMSGESRDWSEDEITLVEVVSAEMRAVVDSTSMMVRERNIANTLQTALLPQPHLSIQDLDIATYYKAALAEARIGGDFCDIFHVRGTQWALVVGDVSGKGLRAASQIATVRNMLRTVLYLDDCISCSIGKLNAMLTTHKLLHGFVTLFVAVYDTADRSLTYVNCGHEPALLRRVDGSVVEMNFTGPVLGVIEDAIFAEGILRLEVSDTVVVYTDGASEAGPTRSTQLGVDGLTRLLRSQAANATSDQISHDLASNIQAFAEGNLHDDICLLVIVAA